MKRIVILGGGISGLACGYFLKKSGHFEITILEKEKRVGGWINTVQKDGFLFEEGPKAFRLDEKGKKTLQLVTELKVDHLKAPMGKKFLYIDQKLRPFNLALFLKKGGLGAILRDLTSEMGIKEDQTIEEFFTNRFGEGITKVFIDPMVRGIFGGDISSLSLRSCLPFFYELKKRGDLSKKLFFQNKKVPMVVLSKGVGSLVKRLEESLSHEILRDHEVVDISKKGETFEVMTKQKVFVADHVIAAVPSFAVARIVPEYAFLKEIRFLSLTTLHLGFKQPHLKKRGFGYLVPSIENEKILGMTWDSEIFSQKEQTNVCILFEGEITEQDALSRAHDVLKRHLEISAKPDQIHHHIASNAIPQYGVGHHEILRELSKLGISFLGQSYHGVGINECVFHAKRVATSFFSTI